MIQRDFEIPWQENSMSSKQANDRGLIGLRGIAQALGYSNRTVEDWVQMSDFPEPKGRVEAHGRGAAVSVVYQRLYSKEEVANWYLAARKNDRVRKSRRELR